MRNYTVMVTMLFLLTLFIVCYLSLASQNKIPSAEDNLDTLQLLHVIFRHGDRTNDVQTIYPNDPYRNFTYPPIGYGRLTNRGKQRIFKLGSTLKNQYGSFLGKYHSEELIEARSTASPRAIVSMQLALAGLFPPRDYQIWNYEYNWQPLPFTFVPTQQDKELQGYRCRNYNKIYHEYQKSPENLKNMENYTRLFEYLSLHTGWEINNFEKAAYVNAALQIEEEWGLTLPEWTKPVWPELVQAAQHQYYFEMTANDLMMKYTAGFLVKKILEDTQNKLAEQELKDRKLFLYSCHDYNVAFLLRALNLFNRSRNPTYGSYIVIELHKIKEIYGFKILYENYSKEYPELLDIPNCGMFCPIDQFMQLVENYIPEDDLKCGREC